MHQRILIIFLLLLSALGTVRSQDNMQTELFCGAELNYADVNFTRLYNVLLNLTPGTKVHLGHDWEVAAQAYIPAINLGYAKRMNMVRLNMANVSKVMRFDDAHQYVKFTAGLFGKERWGADARWMFPVCSWLMVHARAGLTSHWALGIDEEGNSESEFSHNDWTLTGMLGASIWLDKWNTELRASGGRYLQEDYGAEGEIIRHFNHCSVSAYMRAHEEGVFSSNTRHHYSGGFRVIMMLPPYKKSEKRLVIRPASNFRLTYSAQANGTTMQQFNTDPEENERTYPIRIPWGTGKFNE